MRDMRNRWAVTPLSVLLDLSNDLVSVDVDAEKFFELPHELAYLRTSYLHTNASKSASPGKPYSVPRMMSRR